MSLPEAVVFDNDGTLLDTEQAWTRAETELFARRGVVFEDAHKKDLLGSSRTTAAGKLEAILERPGEGFALYDELHELVMEEALKGVAPRPGAAELIAQLRAAGVPLAVASNSERPFLERVLDGARWLDAGVFDAVVSATDVDHPKPAPDLYLRACEALGAQPTRSFAFEDSATGVASAVAAGLRTIGVPYFPGEALPGAHVMAASLADPVVLAELGLDPVAT